MYTAEAREKQMRNADDRKKITPECLYGPPLKLPIFSGFWKTFFVFRGQKRKSPTKNRKLLLPPNERGENSNHKHEKERRKTGRKSRKNELLAQEYHLFYYTVKLSKVINFYYKCMHKQYVSFDEMQPLAKRKQKLYYRGFISRTRPHANPCLWWQLHRVLGTADLFAVDKVQQ